MEEVPLVYQVFALCFRQEDAVEYFAANLPAGVVAAEGKGYSEFYQAILDFHKYTDSNPIDKIAFQSWLETETHIFDALGGYEGIEQYFKSIMDIELSTPQSVAGVLLFRHRKTEQEGHAERLVELVSQKTRDEISVSEIDQLSRKIQQLNTQGADPLKTVHDGSLIAGRASDLWELPDFLSTPFPSLNVAMGYSTNSGFCKGAVHAVIAASGFGKSTFSKCLMNHWVDTGHTVLFVNYEEALEHWERVLFTQITKQNVYKGEELSDTEKQYYSKIFEEKMREWDGRFIVKHDPDTPFFEDLEAWLRDIAHRRMVPDVIIIDTIQSMFLRSGRGLPRWAQYEEMMVRLEKLAKDLKTVIIITAQENANRMKERREVVQQSDAGGSLTIIQKSSITIFITPISLQIGNDAADDNIMQLQIPKNRITGHTFMTNPPLVRYNDNYKTYESYEPPTNISYDAESVLSDILDGTGDFI